MALGTDIKSDRSLLEEFRAGGEGAAEELYRRYAGRLRTVARARLSANAARRVEPEDIVQSVFRRFFRAASQGLYDCPSQGDLWNLLLVIALNRLRAEEVFQRAAKRDVRQCREIGAVKSSELPPAGEGDPGDGSLSLTLRDILERLPAQLREVIALRVEGHDVAAIARQLGRSKRTVERLLGEERDRLRQLLREEG